jgi:hypothetical protein
MTLLGNGNLGIGEGNPANARLVIGGDVSGKIAFETGTTGTLGQIVWRFNSNSTEYATMGIEYDNRAGDGFLLDSGYPISLDCTTQMNFKVAGTTVGTWNANNIQVQAGAGEWARIYGGGSAGDGAWAQYFDSASNHMGYVGFPGNEDLHLQANCANPASQIFIRTAVGYCAYFNADGYFKPYTNNVFRCGVAGMVWNEVHTTDVYTHDGGVHTSDVLEKTDVIDTPLGVDFIKELRPVQYRWIDGTRSHQGFIAQDVETVLNGTAGTTASDQGMWCVVEVDTTDDINEDVLDDDGNVVGVERTTVPGEQFERQSLRYNELMAPMVKALQEIVTRLEVLESA